MLDAVDVVDAIIERKPFKQCGRPRRVRPDGQPAPVIVNTGNHDVARPCPRSSGCSPPALWAQTCGPRPARVLDHRRRLSMHGGWRRVFCTHGNETDRLELQQLRRASRFGRRVELGQRLEEWHPNAGTRLVKEVMNEVKAPLAWIDLLKPERDLQLTLGVSTLAGSASCPIEATIVPAALTPRERDRRLNESSRQSRFPTASDLDQLLAQTSAPHATAIANHQRRCDAPLSAEDAPRRRTWHHGSAGRNPWVPVSTSSTGCSVGSPSQRKSKARRCSTGWKRRPQLRDWHFDMNEDDRRDHRSAGTNFRSIIAGHTHLARLSI